MVSALALPDRNCVLIGQGEDRHSAALSDQTQFPTVCIVVLVEGRLSTGLGEERVCEAVLMKNRMSANLKLADFTLKRVNWPFVTQKKARHHAIWVI